MRFSSNLLNPKQLIGCFGQSEQGDLRDPSANLLIPKDLTSY
jgi:hypothetical protein